MTPNALYYGDNLDILRTYVADGTVDLVYLDPPFNSNATYNVLFKATGGESSQAQIEAFGDTWHWNISAERAFDDVIQSGNSDAANMIMALRSFLGENDMMAYLAMMAARLIELHRVLKPTGSLYLHCDPTASHYLKIILDAVFSPKNFRSEIVWKRTYAHGSAKRWGDVHDTIFHYSRSSKFVWNKAFQSHGEDYVEGKYRFTDDRGRYRLVVLTAPGTRQGASGKMWRGYDPTAAGRHWAVPARAIHALRSEGVEVPATLHGQLDLLLAHDYIRFPEKRDGSLGVPEFKLYLEGGQAIQDIILDIPPINSQAQERLGYPTQKPLALLERIIQSSSNPGDVVLDPFCGCGTTIHAAQKLGRRWIGIDITHLAVSLIKRRLQDAFPMATFDMLGVPKDADSAAALALADKHQFQLWALSMVEAQPYKGGKKGSDGGVDGYIYFKPDGKTTEKAIVSVKGGGHVSDTMVKDLITTVEHENAKMGVFITLTPPTKPMVARAATAGFYGTFDRKYQKIQILTVADLFAGKQPEMPFRGADAYKLTALGPKGAKVEQGQLDI